MFDVDFIAFSIETEEMLSDFLCGVINFTPKLCWYPCYFNCRRLLQNLLVSDSQYELANHISSLVEIINIIYASRLEIQICYLVWKTTLNYRLSWQKLHQIVLSKFDEAVDKLTSCYQIFEPQAVAAVIPQKGNKWFGRIWKQTTSQTSLIWTLCLNPAVVSDKQGIASKLWH